MPESFKKNLGGEKILLPEINNKALVLLKDLVLIFSFSFLTAISAKFKIEIGPVPITLQTLVVLLSGAFLGAKKGATSQVFYLLGGVAGFPWFSRGGGIPYLFSPTLGYIMGFIFAAYLVGFLTEKGGGKDIKSAVLVMLIGNIVIYIPALIWLLNFFDPQKTLLVGLYPFIIGDLAKLILAGLILAKNQKLIEEYKPR